MFIIVETIEDGEVNLCVVPESWEENGILFWPPGRKGLNLRKDESILPDFNNWSKQKCTVKRKNFITFQAAIKAEKYLSRFDDTEDEENYLAQNSSKQIQRSQNKDNIDFNNLITENNIINNNIGVIENIENYSVDSVPTFVQIPKSSQELETTMGFTDAIVIENDGISTLPLSNSQKPLDAVQIQEKFDTINSNLENLKNYISRDISALHVKFDKLIDLLIKNQTNSVIEKSENDPLKSEILERDIEQMKSLAIESDINNLEKNLCNQEFELAFIKVMSEIGGTTGKKDGNKIAYLLMDRLFERQLLTLCSWTGSTKKKEEKMKKIAFFKYNRITEAIYKIIHLADSRYTIDDNIGFLKRILKNSVSRSKQLQKQRSKQNENSEEANDRLQCDDNHYENIEEETTENTGGIIVVTEVNNDNDNEEF
ncbi:uncharacterized protein LOC115244088 [Formica exsecta]|uniref:uncharacterized protein LOC115244088 n=1 Tax=Formica exsecta TaxID=72781 RepID=UPI001141FAA8|nr:uncharacterized protein LOC115244088 [Formica exsecta]